MDDRLEDIIVTPDTGSLAPLSTAERAPAEPAGRTIVGTRADAQLKTLIRIGGLILLVSVLLLSAQAWQLFKGVASQRQRWEYAIEAPPDDELQKRLQTIGAAGWEIVSARRATSNIDGKSTAAYEMILRRPLEITDVLPVPVPAR